MKFLQRLFNLIENRTTFKPQLAVACDLSKFSQQRAVLDGSSEKIVVRYHLNDSPHFIFFSHGNGSTVDGIAHIYDFYQQLGVSYLAYDYPGYGESTGQPSEQGCYQAFELAFDFVSNQLKIPMTAITCHGLSLGGAVTIHCARSKPIERVVLEATFTSGSAMAKHKFPYLPLIERLPKQFDSLSKIHELRARTLFIHGELDEVVPLKHSQQLFERCQADKQLYIIPGCGHARHAELGGAEYLRVWKEFLGGL